MEKKNSQFRLADKLGYESPFDNSPFRKDWAEKREREKEVNKLREKEVNKLLKTQEKQKEFLSNVKLETAYQFLSKVGTTYVHKTGDDSTFTKLNGFLMYEIALYFYMTNATYIDNQKYMSLPAIGMEEISSPDIGMRVLPYDLAKYNVERKLKYEQERKEFTLIAAEIKIALELALNGEYPFANAVDNLHEIDASTSTPYKEYYVVIDGKKWAVDEKEKALYHFEVLHKEIINTQKLEVDEDPYGKGRTEKIVEMQISTNVQDIAVLSFIDGQEKEGAKGGATNTTVFKGGPITVGLYENGAQRTYQSIARTAAHELVHLGGLDHIWLAMGGGQKENPLADMWAKRNSYPYFFTDNLINNLMNTGDVEKIDMGYVPWVPGLFLFNLQRRYVVQKLPRI